MYVVGKINIWEKKRNFSSERCDSGVSKKRLRDRHKIHAHINTITRTYDRVLLTRNFVD